MIITTEAERLIRELLSFQLEEAGVPRWAEYTIGLLGKELEKSKKLFCYSKANTMDGYLQNDDCHRYTDDVALCYAENLEEAYGIFNRLYDTELLKDNVQEVEFNNYGIFIATDF